MPSSCREVAAALQIPSDKDLIAWTGRLITLPSWDVLTFAGLGDISA